MMTNKLLKQDTKVMFDLFNKKRFGVIVGFFMILNRLVYLVKMDKPVEDYAYDCVGVYENAIVSMEEETINIEKSEIKRGGCYS